jgi:hypothetical protein
MRVIITAQIKFLLRILFCFMICMFVLVGYCRIIHFFPLCFKLS